MDSLTPIFVSDPVLNKDGITAYTSYTLQGTRVPEPLIRRYRDFDCLRNKLMERWPGIFIPNIPHKKKVGALEKEVVDMRIEMINRFLKKNSQIDYLYNSDGDDVGTFTVNGTPVSIPLNILDAGTYTGKFKAYIPSKPATPFEKTFTIIIQ